MLFRYPSAAATHLVDCCIVRLRTMSSGDALSSPHDCLESIKTNLTAANAAIVSTRAMASPAPGESPLEGFLTAMGLNSRTILSSLASKDDRFKEALQGNKSTRGDDSFAHLADLKDHIFKCAEMIPPTGGIVSGASTGQATQDARNKLSGYLLDMCEVMALVIRQETYDKVLQVQNTSVGIATASCSSTITNIESELAKASKMLKDIESSIDDFTKLKTPQSDTRDEHVTECVANWQFSHDSYVNRASLELELKTAKTECADLRASKTVKYQAADGSEKEEKWKAPEKAAAVKVYTDKIKNLKEDIEKEKEMIHQRMRGTDAVVKTNTDPMVWPMFDDGEAIREEDFCTKLARLLASFMAGREHLFPLPFQAIKRLIHDYIPYGDNKSQFDHADLPFDDSQVPNLRSDFKDQDRLLYRVWETSVIPRYIEVMVQGGAVTHDMGASPEEVYTLDQVSACSLIRAILLVKRPLSEDQKRSLDNDVKGIHSNFKKGSPQLAVTNSLAIISRNQKYQLPISIKDILRNIVNTLFVRFQQEFGQVHRDFGDSMNEQWNSRVDITESLSRFLNITILPIARALETAQSKRAKASNIDVSEMWASTSYETMQKARVGGDSSSHGAHRASGAPKGNNTSKKRPREKPSEEEPRQVVASQATHQGKGKPGGGYPPSGKGGKGGKGGKSSKGSKGKGGKGGKGAKGSKGKGTYPPHRPNWQPNGTPDAPTMLPPTETQKLWVGTCAQDKCYRPHDGTGWKRSGDKPVIYCESCTEHLSQMFTKWGQKGLWCKDNNQRSAFGRLTQKGGPRRTSEAHTANSAYVALTDDSIPKPKVQGTWYEDADADGGYRFEKDQFQQVVQAEATQQDPFGRAYLANPDHVVLTDDTEILNRAPEVEEVMVDNPNMFGSLERSDSDDDSPQDEPRDQHGYTQQEWNDWNYQMGKPPPTLEQNLTWISGTDGGYPQDIYTDTNNYGEVPQ